MATSGEEKDQTFGPERGRRWSDLGALNFILARWRGLGLSLQFLLTVAGSMILLSSLAGTLQGRLIRTSLIESNARIASIYMRAIIAPHVQELAIAPTLSTTSRDALERSLEDSGLWTEINVVTVWRPDGLVLYSSDETMIGRQFQSAHVEEAARGQVVISEDEPDHEAPATMSDDLFEIYIPITGPTGEVLAVGEFYQDMRTTRAGLMRVVRGSWLIRLASIGAAVFVLFLLVRDANGIILRQQARLKRLYELAKRRAAENHRLRSAADDARRRGALSNENLLSRLGSELHDGPLQLLSLAMLLSGESKSAAAPSDHNATRPHDYASLTADAITQLREISAGLILPEINELSPTEALRLAVVRHQNRTGTQVLIEIEPLPETMSHELKACLYRVVQELLTNATRHAQGKGQQVSARSDGSNIILAVSDEGPGMTEVPARDGRPRLGLIGVRLRIDGFGGRLDVQSKAGSGTNFVVTVPLEDGRLH